MHNDETGEYLERKDESIDWSGGNVKEYNTRLKVKMAWISDKEGRWWHSPWDHEHRSRKKKKNW